MKRNALLLFGLIGILILEYGCRDKVSPTIEYLITGVDTTQWSKYRGELRGSCSYDSLILTVDFLSIEMISHSLNSGFSAYALSVVGIEPQNNFDSILVSSDNVDYTDHFYSMNNGSQLRNISKPSLDFGISMPLSLRFALQKPLKEVPDTFQFTFQFFDTQGNIFETTTDPIIITP